MLRAVDLSVSYKWAATERRLSVIRNLSLAVPSGGYLSLIGPSGCGKTTLLLSLAGLLPVDSGVVELGGSPPAIACGEHRIGMVFQKPVFFEWKNVLANVAMAAEIADRVDSSERAIRYLEALHLNGFANAFPHELSGGMLARAALARALVHEPDFLFLDEAFNNLDEALRDTINLDIQRLWLERRATIIAVTHSISEAVLMSDRVLVLTHKPTTVAQAFDIPFDRPRSTTLRTDSRFISLTEEVRRSLERIYKGSTGVPT